MPIEFENPQTEITRKRRNTNRDKFLSKPNPDGSRREIDGETKLSRLSLERILVLDKRDKKEITSELAKHQIARLDKAI